MSIDLSDYTEALLREVNPVGTTVFSESDLDGYLPDAFWEAKLDGFLSDWTCTEAGVVTPVVTGGADMTRAEVSLCILYAGIKIIRNKVLNTKTLFRAKGGPAEFEQQSSATMLAEMLKQLENTKNRLLTQSDLYGFATSVQMLDVASIRMWNTDTYFGSEELAG